STAAAPGMGDPFSAQSPQAARERRPACSSGSLQSLQVGPYDALDPAVPRMLKEVLDVPPRPPSPEPERLKDYVHAELVPELEGVGDRLLGAVDANWNAVDLVNVDALTERGPGELEDTDRWVVDPGRVLFAALDGDVHFVRHLGRELVEGERRDEADDSFRDPRRHGHEIGASQRRQVPQPKETPAQLLEDAGVAHRVEGL